MVLAFIACIVAWVVAIVLKGLLPPEQMETAIIVLVVVLSAIFGGMSWIWLAKRQQRDSVAWRPTMDMLWLGSVAAAHLVAGMVRLPNYTPRNSTAVIASIAFFVVWWLTRALWLALPDHSGPYVFVSYKSEDATVVRKVVEQLMYRGMCIWFAEHHVLLTNYERFQRTVYRAITHSQHAIVFTNDAWANSKYVKEEMRQILAWGAPERVVEVRVPTSGSSVTALLPRNNYGEFTSHEPLTLTDPNDCLTLLEKIEALVGRRAAQRARPLPLSSLMASGSFAVHPLTGYGIKTGPFTADRTVFENLSDGVGGWSWSTDLGDEKAQSLVKMMVQMRRGKTSIGQVFQGDIDDDRRLYDAYRVHARRWVATGSTRWMPIAAKGLHLIRPECSCDVAYGRRISTTHFGLTYLTRARDGMNSWERRYEYALPDPDGGSWVELDLIFWLKLSPVNEDEEFRTFCWLTPLFDCIAESLVYRQESRRTSGPNEFVLEEPKLVARKHRQRDRD